MTWVVGVTGAGESEVVRVAYAMGASNGESLSRPRPTSSGALSDMIRLLVAALSSAADDQEGSQISARQTNTKMVPAMKGLAWFNNIRIVLPVMNCCLFSVIKYCKRFE